MEVFTPPPYREKRPTGRQPILSTETRLLVAKKVTSKEMTYREAAKTFGISTGAVAACVRLMKSEGDLSKRRKRDAEFKSEVVEYRHHAQIKELKQEIADLYLENQMLKKIVNKSLQIKKFAGSVITTENLDQLQEDVE